MSHGLHFLLVIHGGVEPELLGPFEDDESRDSRARELHRGLEDDSTILTIDSASVTELEIGSYTGGFFEMNEEEMEEEHEQEY